MTTHSGQSNMRPKIVKLIAGAKVVAVRFDEKRINHCFATLDPSRENH